MEVGEDDKKHFFPWMEEQPSITALFVSPFPPFIRSNMFNIYPFSLTIPTTKSTMLLQYTLNPKCNQGINIIITHAIFPWSLWWHVWLMMIKGRIFLPLSSKCSSWKKEHLGCRLLFKEIIGQRCCETYVLTHPKLDIYCRIYFWNCLKEDR